mgnify:CR=1 FL=1
MNIDKVLHIVRNPSGFDTDTIREARIRLADAYENAIKNYEIAMISLKLKVNQAPAINYFTAKRIANLHGLNYNKFCAAYRDMVDATKEDVK